MRAFAPRRLVEALASEGVAYVILGGLALTMHGSTRATFDLDICYERDRANLRRLAAALAPLHPRLRDFPPELPFFFDEATLRSGLNFTLRSDAGDVDLLDLETIAALRAEITSPRGPSGRRSPRR